MLYQITGDTDKGRGYCNHFIRKKEPYYIERVGNELHALCSKCVGKGKRYAELVVPDCLVDGAIPIR